MIVVLSALMIASFVYADHRARRRPVDRVLQQLRPRLGTAAGCPGGGAGALREVAEVVALDARRRGIGGHLVVRRLHRRREGVSGTVGIGPGGRDGVVHPQRRQPDGRPAPVRHRRPVARGQPTAGDEAVRVVGLDGLLALPVALAAVDLLVGVLGAHARELRRGRRRPPGVRPAGLVDDEVHRGTPAPAGVGRRASQRRSRPT